MTHKKRVLLKLTGEILSNPITKKLDASRIRVVIEQIKQLAPTHQFGIVIGGGNFFRGSKQSMELGIPLTAGHQVGMLATIMNGLILKELLEQNSLQATLLCAIPTPGIGLPTSQQDIAHALTCDNVLIFAGGTGNPFFTTDTNAIVRALQMNAQEIWKGTNVDGVYSDDPNQDAHAELLAHVTYQDALAKKLAIMDATAFVLAEQHNQIIKIFNIFTKDALLLAAHDKNFGSILSN